MRARTVDQTGARMSAMRVTMLYFAAARERAGLSSETLDLPDGATAAQALALACEKHPALQAVAGKLRVAVDQDFAQADRALHDGSEVALIPPVSGGMAAHRIGPEPIDPDAPLREVTGTDCGAVVSFTGTVRSSNHGKAVVRLEYEAYPEMALRVFAHIASEAHERSARCQLPRAARRLREQISRTYWARLFPSMLPVPPPPATTQV